MGNKLKNIVFNFDNFSQDIEDYLHTYSKAYVSAARKDLTEKTCEIVRYFYASYTPDYYDRTYDFMNNSYRPYYKHSRATYYGGVKLSSLWMSNYVSSSIFHKKENVKRRIMSSDAVFQNAWNGVHGVMQEVTINRRGESKESFNSKLKVTSPSPYDKLMNYYDMIIKDPVSSYEIYASKQAKGHLYRLIMFE